MRRKKIWSFDIDHEKKTRKEWWFLHYFISSSFCVIFTEFLFKKPGNCFLKKCQTTMYLKLFSQSFIISISSWAMLSLNVATEMNRTVSAFSDLLPITAALVMEKKSSPSFHFLSPLPLFFSELSPSIIYHFSLSLSLSIYNFKSIDHADFWLCRLNKYD